MVIKVQGADILREVLDRWKAGIDTQQPGRVADAFTKDAIFQGLRTYSVGRQGVQDYYASQSAGMTVAYRILESRMPADDLVLGYVHADFSFPDRPTVKAHLGVLVKRDGDSWSIVYYQASAAGSHQRRPVTLRRRHRDERCTISRANLPSGSGSARRWSPS